MGKLEAEALTFAWLALEVIFTRSGTATLNKKNQRRFKNT